MYLLLVHRFINNDTNRAECGSLPEAVNFQLPSLHTTSKADIPHLQISFARLRNNSAHLPQRKKADASASALKSYVKTKYALRHRQRSTVSFQNFSSSARIFHKNKQVSWLKLSRSFAPSQNCFQWHFAKNWLSQWRGSYRICTGFPFNHNNYLSSILNLFSMRLIIVCSHYIVAQ